MKAQGKESNSGKITCRMYGKLVSCCLQRIQVGNNYKNIQGKKSCRNKKAAYQKSIQYTIAKQKQNSDIS